MQRSKSNPFTRPDTLFGVCEALGEDFRFNPILLRVPLALPLVWSPMMAIGAYAALGLLVLISRLLFPVPRAARVAASQEARPTDAATQVAPRQPIELPAEEMAIAA